MHKAVYAGSFDPPTRGHIWLACQAARQFDEVVVLVATNPGKQPMFSAEERRRLLEESLATEPNIRVEILGNQFVAKYAHSIGAAAMVRGIRNESDFGSEQTLQDINLQIEPSVQSVFFMPPPGDIVDVSSSAVKALVGPEGWELFVEQLVPRSVFMQLIGHRHRWIYEDLVRQGAKVAEYDFWKTMLRPYFEPHRSYHTWRHLSEGLEELCAVRHTLQNPGLVGFSWLAHDRFYDVWCATNEEDSGSWALTYALQISLPDSFGDASYHMILATKEHQSDDPDTQKLIGADTAILGYGEVRFDEYLADVRAEYLYRYTPEEFRAGRLAWTRKFLDQHPSCFYADQAFEEKYGVRARENLERSLKLLQS